MYRRWLILTLLVCRTIMAAAQADLPNRVDPLMGTVNRWHQYSEPYWNKTPLVDEKHCMVGCVALAQARVMHYWKHPERGTGSYTYIDSTGCGQTLTADFAAHTYGWDKMLYEYKDGNYTDEEVEPMALLMSDCGISLNTRYGTDSSGAHMVMQPISLTSYFGYDQGVQIHFRDFYKKDEITRMLKTELAEGRPVLVAGYNYLVGHAFVIDGYNEDDRFHVLLGNPDGEGDGWTSLESMNGSHGEDDPDPSPESGLNVLQVFVTGIQPQGSPDATGVKTHVFAMESIYTVMDEEQGASDEKHTVCVKRLANIGWDVLDGDVALQLVKDGNIVQTLYTYDRTFELEELADTAYTDTVCLNIDAATPEGEYLIVPMFCDGGTWKAVRTTTGQPNHLLCSVENNQVTLTEDIANTAFLTMNDLNMDDYIVNGTAPDVSITLTNHNVEASGRIYFKMEPLNEGMKEFTLYNQGYTLMGGETRTFRFCKKKIYAPAIGEYRLRVMYNNNLLSSELTELTDPDTPIFVSIIYASDIQIAQALNHQPSTVN